MSPKSFCHNPAAHLCSFLFVRYALYQVLLVLRWDVVDVDLRKDLMILHAVCLFVHVCFKLCFVEAFVVVDDGILQFKILLKLSCSVVSSLDAVVILSPGLVANVLLFARLLVGDGSSVPGLSLAVPGDVLACLLVLPSAIVSSCTLLSGVAGACLPLRDVGDVAAGESVIACLVAGKPLSVKRLLDLQCLCAHLCCWCLCCPSCSGQWHEVWRRRCTLCWTRWAPWVDVDCIHQLLVVLFWCCPSPDRPCSDDIAGCAEYVFACLCIFAQVYGCEESWF